MPAYGPKRQKTMSALMSAIGGKAEMLSIGPLTFITHCSRQLSSGCAIGMATREHHLAGLVCHRK